MHDEDDERRNAETTRLKGRVRVLEQNYEKLERLSYGMSIALFGIPEDKHSNGLIGEMHEVKRIVERGNNRLVGLLLTVLSAIAIDVLTRASGG